MPSRLCSYTPLAWRQTVRRRAEGGACTGTHHTAAVASKSLLDAGRFIKRGDTRVSHSCCVAGGMLRHACEQDRAV